MQTRAEEEENDEQKDNVVIKSGSGEAAIKSDPIMADGRARA
jgi:hypothetical protein